MKKWQKILLLMVFGCSFIAGLITYMPAWIVGGLLSKYSQQRLKTINEIGTFWHGQALLIAVDEHNKTAIPLLSLGWKIKLGFKQLVGITFTSSNQTIANAALTKAGLVVENVNLALSLDQITPLVSNLNSLSLSGNVHLEADKLLIANKMQGSVNVKLDNVASGMAPVNPIGSYQVGIDLATYSISISSDQDSLIKVSGDGSTNGLVLNARIKETKKDQLLQFMTMIGIPQADGSYQLKVF